MQMAEEKPSPNTPLAQKMKEVLSNKASAIAIYKPPLKLKYCDKEVESICIAR